MTIHETARCICVAFMACSVDTGCTGPTVTSIEPGAAAVGESVTIAGSHFGTTQGPSIVRFNGLSAGAAVTWSDGEIAVAVPAGAQTGPLLVEVGGLISGPKPFVVSRPRLAAVRDATRLPAPPDEAGLGFCTSPAASIEPRVGSSSTSSQHTSFAVDLNGDDNVDILQGRGAQLCRYLGDGAGRITSALCADVQSAGIGGITADRIDGDSIADIIFADTFNDRIGIIHGDGLGGLAQPVFFPAGQRPGYPLAVDFDRDGDLDIAVLGFGNTHAVQVLYGDGSGGFSAPTPFPVATRVHSIAAGDLDGDSYPDIVVSDPAFNLGDPGQLSILLNDGLGGFLPETRITTDLEPTGLVIEDFNRDGHADIAVAHDLFTTTDNSVEVFLGDGTGAFSAPLRIPAYPAQGLATADFNGDAIADLVVGGAATYLGFGNGDFLLWDASSSLGGQGVVTADFDRDGRLDVYTSSGNFGEAVLLGDGAGGLGSATWINLAPAIGAPRGLAAGDWNGDGDLDLATVIASAPTDQLQILLGDGRGGFSSSLAPLSQSNPGFLASGDFDADGDADLVRFRQVGVDYYLDVHLGHGDGTFDVPGIPITIGDYAYSIAVADLDLDGRDDVVVGSLSGIQRLRSNGDGSFTLAPIYPFTTPGWEALAVGLLNADPYPDIVFKGASASSDGDMRVLLSDGAGGYTLAATFEANDGRVYLGDVDGDGHLDLVDHDLAQTHPASYRVRLGDGSGGFSTPVESLYQGDLLAVADLDGDGRTDAIGTTTFSVWIGLGTAGGGFLATPDCYFHYSPIDAAVGTFDDDGTVDVAFTNAFDQLHLFLGDGAGGFVDRD